MRNFSPFVWKSARELFELFDSLLTQKRQRRISTPESNVEGWIVQTNEELAIARETVALL